MAETPEEEQRRRRRKRLIRGLLVGGAALGLPALINAVVARRAKRLPRPSWGRPRRYRWAHGEIAFQRLGDEGEPLLLLHSLGPGHCGQQWREVAELLAPGHRVYVPDFLGWGDSERPSRVYDGDLYIQQIIDFLGDVVRGRAAIVGSGLSAAYAVQVAVDHPELTERLGLVVPVGIDLHGDEPDLKDAIVHRLLKLPILGTSALNLFTSRASLGHYLRRETFAEAERADDGLVDQHYRYSHLPGARAALAAYVSGYLNHRVTDVVARVEVPVWIAWGRQAKSPAVESADLWLRDLPSAELTVLEGCGALPQVECPQELAIALGEFLDVRQRA